MAEATATRAFQLDEGEAGRHYAAAIELEKRGFFAWAEREYRYLIALDPPSSESLILAGNRLSLMLHDQGEPLQAAQALQATIDRIEKILAKRRPQPRRRPARTQPVRDPLRARAEYYLAAHDAQAEDWAAQRAHLDRAIRYDPLDADVLIAMYRLPDADADYREETRALIRKAVATFRQRSKQSPRDATPLNQLAWLVSNTEGDLDEALAASRRSLKLEPGLAGYLDTLAHCYYAQKDYARAVRVQSQAARIEPHTQAIHRQLEVFQRAWEESRRQPVTESQNATDS
jgi:tetratricopeptide (TPR) repeat protein